MLELTGQNQGSHSVSEWITGIRADALSKGGSAALCLFGMPPLNQHCARLWLPCRTECGDLAEVDMAGTLGVWALIDA